MKPREFMTFGALFYLVLSDVYGLFRQRVILTGVRKYSYTFYCCPMKLFKLK